jgi:hypothetical protein
MTHMVFADTQWFKPTTEKDVTAILDANKGKKIRFLLGNTAKGKIIYFYFSDDNWMLVIVFFFWFVSYF